MTTAANVKKSESGHWYEKNGTPAYTVIAKGTGLPRQTTLADARKLGLLPSVTTILRILDKPALTSWKIEQAVLAVLTTPRLAGEADDAFTTRVLSSERVQDQEAAAAADLGTTIHDALEKAMNGQQIGEEIAPWVRPAIDALKTYGIVHSTEKILVGDGYAGKTDLILETEACYWLFDAKSTKKLPDPKKGGAWSEHRLQAAAYASAFSDHPMTRGAIPIKTANIYISTAECGKFVICEHEDWGKTYEFGFAPLVEHWQWATGYTP